MDRTDTLGRVGGRAHSTVLSQSFRCVVGGPTSYRVASDTLACSIGYLQPETRMEDMLYGAVRSVRRARLPGPLPDETTILNFRHLLARA